MAAATSIIAGASALIGAGTAASGAIGANKAKKALNNYKRQDLTNAFENMKISTAGADIMREEGARTTNSLISSVTRGGARAITGNVGRIASLSNDVNSRAAMEIDRQYQDRNRLIAQENSRIQDMYERREEADLAGLGQELQANRETMWNGISAVQSGLNFGAQNGMFNKGTPTQRPMTSTAASPGFKSKGYQYGSYLNK